MAFSLFLDFPLNTLVRMFLGLKFDMKAKEYEGGWDQG